MGMFMELLRTRRFLEAVEAPVVYAFMRDSAFYYLLLRSSLGVVELSGYRVKSNRGAFLSLIEDLNFYSSVYNSVALWFKLFKLWIFLLPGSLDVANVECELLTGVIDCCTCEPPLFKENYMVGFSFFMRSTTLLSLIRFIFFESEGSHSFGLELLFLRPKGGEFYLL